MKNKREIDCCAKTEESPETISGEEECGGQMMSWCFGSSVMFSDHWGGCYSCTSAGFTSRLLWGNKNCITHNPLSEQNFCFFHAALMIHTSTFHLRLCRPTPSTATSELSPSAASGGGGRGGSQGSGSAGGCVTDLSEKRRCQRGEREPGAGSRQLSRLPPCVTGSWNRS